MKRYKIMLIALVSGLSTCSCKQASEKKIQEPFKYLVDEFADIKIIRFQIPGWDSLSLQQKEYIYHLSEAVKCGRDIFWDQNSKYGLKVRRVIESILDNYKGDKECGDYKEFTVYAKRVFFSNGIHHHYAEEKIIPGCSKEYFGELMSQSGLDSLKQEMLPVIFDLSVAPYRKNISGKGDLIAESAVNFYEGVTYSEAESFYAKMEVPNDSRPVSYGLNSRLVKKNGILMEETYKVGGLYGDAIEKIVYHLDKAAKVAENDIQKQYIKL
ncbi:MAG: dihydrofolate reductase, partial [Bacteroidales bacterium]|nr:dihydrofolate reductase [Bacteroidales bacterium]